MKADDQARDGWQAGVPPGLRRTTADREHAGSREAGGQRPCGAFWDLLSQAERAALNERGQARAFQAGDVLRAEGEETTDVLVLTVGWVKILSLTAQRREMVLALRGPGEIVGELAGSCTGYRTATVAALTPVQALVVTYDAFSLLLDSNPGANRAYRSALAHRWNEAMELLRSRALDNGSQRLAGLLLDLTARHGTPAGPATAISIPLTQDEIASLIGTSRATVTRALHDWRRRNLITTARHQITINNRQGMHNAAGRRTPGST